MNDQQTDGPQGPTVGNLYERVQRLRQQAEEQKRDYPDNWFPSAPGEEIGGEFLGYADAHHRDGTPATIAHICTPEGDRSVWLTHAVLRDQLRDLNPGDVVYIRYEGKRKSANGYEYHDYRVEREDLAPTTPSGEPF